MRKTGRHGDFLFGAAEYRSLGGCRFDCLWKKLL